MEKIRCSWATEEPSRNYHDKEWGRVITSEQKLFEMLILEGMQAGLSWSIILRKRENFLAAFDNFDIEKCANYSDDFLESQMTNAGIIRSRLKIFGVRKNAQAFLKVQEEFGSFYKYLWQFVDNKKIVNSHKTMADIPTKSELSDKISKDLKKRGFTFVGSVIIYSYLQAVGVINDHIVDCFCYEECE